MWLIDGYNLLFAQRGSDVGHSSAEALSAARRRLLHRLLRHPRLGRGRVTVIFDGNPGPTTGAEGLDERIDVIFSGPDRSADDILVDWVTSSQDPKSLDLVTSDQEIRRRIRPARPRLHGVRDILAQLEEGERKERRARETPQESREKYVGLDDRDADLWLRRFGLDGDSEKPDTGSP